MKIVRLTLALLGLLQVSPFAYGGEILVNGDFESGSISPWINDTRYGTGTGWSITSSGCYAGSYCATDTGNVGLKQTFAGVATSSITDVSFYQTTYADDIAVVDFFYQGGVDDEVVVSGTATGDGSWVFHDATSYLLPNATLVGFEVWGNTTSTPSYVDDLSIVANSMAVPEPGSMMLVSAGLIVMAVGLIRSGKPA
jgi:hypothetical protein